MDLWTTLVGGYRGLSALLNSFAGLAFIGSFAGAVGGAWGIERLTRRRDREKLLRDEFAATRRALALTFGVANTFLDLKMQCIAPVHKEYAEGCSRLAAAANATNLQIPQLTFSLSLLQAPHTQIDALSALIRDRIQMTDPPLIIVNLLADSIDGVTNSITMRNALCNELNGKSRELVFQAYFAVPDVMGRVDRRFGNNITDLFRQTDYCIYFSIALSKVLHRHARRLALTIGDHIGVPSNDFSKLQAYLPDPAGFADHETNMRAWLAEPLKPFKIRN
jgi:hypothetical protein